MRPHSAVAASRRRAFHCANARGACCLLLHQTQRHGESHTNTRTLAAAWHMGPKCTKLGWELRGSTPCAWGAALAAALAALSIARKKQTLYVGRLKTLVCTRFGVTVTELHRRAHKTNVSKSDGGDWCQMTLACAAAMVLEVSLPSQALAKRPRNSPRCVRAKEPKSGKQWQKGQTKWRSFPRRGTQCISSAGFVPEELKAVRLHSICVSGSRSGWLPPSRYPLSGT